jgi:hypothetical protein
VLTPYDDYPIHQAPVPVAHPATGDANHYDRYWFNGYREDLYFGVAMATYPNRGIIDAAFSVVHDGVQRSVFASGRIPADPATTRIGPVTIEIVEPLRVNRIVVDAAELGIAADVTYQARTAAFEEPRQTRYAGTRLVMDLTRLTQWGGWTGTVDAGGDRLDLGAATTYGTKDRSWGIRPVGGPVPGAPERRPPQIFFLWAPLHFDDRCVHYMVFEDATGHRWFETGVVLPVLEEGEPTWGPDAAGEPLAGGDHHVRWAPGLRRSQGATLDLRHRGGETEAIELEPLLTFRMRGIGYSHPEWGHGHWHDELAVGSDEHKVEDLDTLDPTCLHVQQVVRVTARDGRGMGVLEQIVFGPHAPSGFRELLDGARG